MKKLIINWIKPKLSDEIEEYTENVYTKKFFRKKGLIFKSDEEILNFLNTGKSATITHSQLSSHYENLTLDPKSFKAELADPDYALSFHSMEKILQDKGTITLPMPIIINFRGLYYGYAGNRRMNLAFKYGIPLKVWLVNVQSGKLVSVASLLKVKAFEIIF